MKGVYKQKMILEIMFISLYQNTVLRLMDGSFFEVTYLNYMKRAVLAGALFNNFLSGTVASVRWKLNS